MHETPRVPWAIPRRSLLLGTMAAPLLGRAVRAQDFPARSIRLVVSYPPGGSGDAVGRLAANLWSPMLGQAVVIDNRAGAGGNVAGEFTARAPANGYTLLVAGQALLAINRALYRNLSFDPATDFTFIGMIAAYRNVLVASRSAAPAETVAALVALGRQRPGGISYGSNGVGSLSHLTAQVMASAAGAEFLHVPYRGASPLLTDLTAGRIGFSFTGAPTAVPLLSDPRLRALAVTGTTRLPQLPDVPTMVELGFPELDSPVWFGVVAPAATPAPVLTRLRETFAAAASSPTWRAALDAQGAEALVIPPDQADAFLAREREIWAKAVRSSGATAE
ncbi:Bug family tripartite tricarboxylate transporter substrate binding protein [Falsiroseomonas sp.]|uniref:Bug family tripartite tricarboxylate transporter substrate binding protein n=1 Tax=Falsiroseomonas sp. TaxID=2870721 RepID=UPI003F730C70